MSAFPEIVEWDCMGWTVRCSCGGHLFVSMEGGDRDLIHTCHQCGAEMRLDFSVDVIETKRATKPGPYRKEEDDGDD